MYNAMKKAKRKITAAVAAALMVLMCAGFLTGCIDADYTKIEEKLEKTEYGYAANSVEAYGITGCSHKIKADKGTKGTQGYEFVFVLYFETEDAAIDYYNDIMKGYSWPALEDEVYYDGLAGSMTYERVFNIVICGTRQAVKDVLS